MDFPTLGDILEPRTLMGALTLALVLALAGAIISWLLDRLMRRSDRVLERLGRHVDETLMTVTRRVKTVVVFVIIGFVYASMVPALRAFLGTIVAGAGVTALIVGFAAKSTLANLVSGVALAFYRPIRIGDKVAIENEYGQIEDITLRHTIVCTWENKRLVIPNEKLDNMSLVNYSLRDRRALLRFEVPISLDSDIDRARRLMIEEMDACPHLLPDDEAPSPRAVKVVEIGQYAVMLRLYAWAADMDAYWEARWCLLEGVKKRFDAEGVEIPTPYRTLVEKKDLPIPQRDPAPGD